MDADADKGKVLRVGSGIAPLDCAAPVRSCALYAQRGDAAAASWRKSFSLITFKLIMPVFLAACASFQALHKDLVAFLSSEVLECAMLNAMK